MRSREFAKVDDAAVAFGEGVVPCREVFVGQLHCGGDQSADINLGISAEEHAVGVEQEDASGAGELAENFGRSGTGDAVEGHASARLGKMHAGGVTDGEAFPVGNHAPLVLRDGHGVAIGDDAASGAASSNLSTSG